MPLTEDLELNIDDALRGVDQVGASLDQVTQQFRVGLAESLTVLDQPLTLEIDQASVEQQISEAVEAADDEQLTLFADLDTSSVDSELGAIEAQPVDVDVLADTANAQEEISALGDQIDTEIDINVQADVTDAVEPLDQLSESATEASAATDVVSTSLANAAAASEVAGTGVASIVGVLSRFAPGATAVVAALASVATATDAFFDSAVAAQASTQRFEQTFEDLSDTVREVNVGSLNTSLAELNLTLGSSTSQTRNALSTFAQLGEAAGASDEEIAATSEQLAALSARAVALNPNLGQVGDVAERLSTALARGGRFAGRYGIALSATEIEARALADTGKSVAAELTVYERAAAGAALATEKYGDSLEQTITEGAQNPIIQLRQLTAEFNKAKAEIGAPLVAPVFDLLREAQPIAIGFARILGDLAQSLVPLLSGIIAGFGPIIEALQSGLTPILDELAPIFTELGEAIGEVILGLLPFVELLSTGVQLISTGVLPVLRFLVDLLQNDVVQALALVVGGLIAVRTAFLFITTLAATNPWLLIAAGVATLAGALIGLKDETDAFAEFDKEVEAAAGTLQSSFFDAATSADSLTTAVADLDAGFASFIATRSEFSEDPALLRFLRDSGIGFSELQRQLETGAVGFRDFVEAGIEAGEITFEVDGVQQTVEDFRKLTDAQVQAKFASFDVTEAFSRQQVALELASEAKINELLASDQITQAQVDEAAARVTTNEAIFTQTLLLRALATEVLPEAVFFEQLLASTSEETQDKLEGQANVVNSLIDSVVRGTVTAENFTTAAQGVGAAVGLTDDELKAFIESVDSGFNQVVEDATANLPTVADALRDIGDAADPQKLIDNLRAQALAITNFQQTIDFLAAFGSQFDDVIEFLVNQGPIVGAEWAAALREGGETAFTELEAALETQEGAIAGFQEDVRTNIAPLIFESGAFVGQRLGEGIGSVNFDPIVAAKLQELRDVIILDPSIAQLAESLGLNLQELFAENVDLVSATDPELIALRDKLLTDPEVRAAAGQLGLDLNAALAGTTNFVPSLDPELDALRLKLITDPTVRAAAETLGIDLAAAVGRADFATSADPALVSLRAFILAQGDSNDPNSVAGVAKQLGVDTALGIASGVEAESGTLNSATANAVLSALFNAKAAIGSDSPSKLAAEEIGRPISQGIALGIEQDADMVNAAFSDLIDDAFGQQVPAVNVPLDVSRVGRLPAADDAPAGGVRIDTVNVTVHAAPGVTAEQVRELSQAAGAGFVEGVESRTTETVVTGRLA